MYRRSIKNVYMLKKITETFFKSFRRYNKLINQPKCKTSQSRILAAILGTL